MIYYYDGDKVFACILRVLYGYKYPSMILIVRKMILLSTSRSVLPHYVPVTVLKHKNIKKEPFLSQQSTF